MLWYVEVCKKEFEFARLQMYFDMRKNEKPYSFIQLVRRLLCKVREQISSFSFLLFVHLDLASYKNPQLQETIIKIIVVFTSLKKI